MRTPLGIESINLLARYQNTLGNPALDLGADLKAILERDHEPSLLFASLINPAKWDRMLCTVSPETNGARHFHRGWISANFNPLGQRIPQGFAWEGLSTIPCAMGQIVQFLATRYDGQTHVMAITDKGDSKGIVEFSQQEGPDWMADGTVKPIKWFLKTKRLMVSDVNSESRFSTAWIHLDDMLEDVLLEVWARTSNSLQFQALKQITVKALAAPGDYLGCGQQGERTICLGELMADFKGYTWAQFLVKGTGTCTVDFSVRTGTPATPAEQPDGDCVNAESPPICDHDPFSTSCG